MTRCPLALWRPLGPQTQPRMAAHDVVVLHTMAGSLAGTDAMFHRNGYGGTESHFGVGAGELVYQWQDLDYTADAQLDGNRRCISIETADTGAPFPRWSGSDVPAWTAEQVYVLARLVAWLAQRYAIPLQLIPDTRPGRRGVGYHRQGIDPWRVAGGERWSSAAGKVCPGDRRVAQVPEVIERARRIAHGTEQAEEDDVTDEDRALLVEVRTMLGKLKPGVVLPARSARARVKSDDHYGAALNAWAEAADARYAAEQVLVRLGQVDARLDRIEARLNPASPPEPP